MPNPFLLLTRIRLLESSLVFSLLTLILIHVTTDFLVAGRRTHTDHSATETDRSGRLILVQEATCTRRQPVSTVGPGATFIYAGFVTDQGMYTVIIVSL